MKTARLLILSILLNLLFFSCLWGQCELIKSNGSSQDPNSVCAPVNFKMNVWYKFTFPLAIADTSLVRIQFVWKDAGDTTLTVPGNWNANLDSVWAEAIHIYPPDDVCSRTANAYLVYDGLQCTSSSIQEQTFSTWGTDEENSGELLIDPPVFEVCEGDPVNAVFNDNSTFNCNINIEPDKPNTYYRWVQFIYGTTSLPNNRIPEITVTDGFGVNHLLTDNTGTPLGTLNGPIVKIPIPANGSTEVSYSITAPPNGIVGDVFELTLKNWNVCNPYDLLPNDGNPPADTINGDNMPIVTTARIEIVSPPPVVTNATVEKCTGEEINLTASASGADINWYADSTLSTLIYTGENFDPTSAPYNLNNNIAGTHHFWVTSEQNGCQSPAGSKVTLILHQSPLSIFAGNNETICADTITLKADAPAVGTGTWSTTSSANIVTVNQYNTHVTNLAPGDNHFTWVIANGTCSISDNVRIRRDILPSPANAGVDTNYCHRDSLILYANTPNNSGTGLWSVLSGSGTVASPQLSNSSFTNPGKGNNLLVWRISSQYGACPVTYDSVNVFTDLYPGDAFAGFDKQVCEVNSTGIVANTPVNNGFGYWSVFNDTTFITDSTDAATLVNQLYYGENLLTWTVESEFGICPTNTDTVVVTRDQSPGVANAGADKAYCLITSDTLNGNAPVIGTGTWQVTQNPSATPPTFIPNNNTPNAIFSVNVSNEGLYQLEWKLENESCISKDTVTIDFGVPPPPASAGKDTSVCDISFQLNANAVANATTYWTVVEGIGSVNFFPDRYDPNAEISILPGDKGIYKLEWSIHSGNCPVTRDTVEILFNSAPTLPAIVDGESCGPDSILLTATPTSSNDIINWYFKTSDTIPYQTGNTYTTDILTADSNYYIRSYDTISGCISSPVTITASIHSVPDPPLLTADTLCGSGSGRLIAYTTPESNQIEWFEKPNDSLPVSQDKVFYTKTLNSTTWFYSRAIDSISACEGLFDSTRVFIWPNIPIPHAQDDSACSPTDFTLQAQKSESGNLLFWYDSDTAGSIIAVNDSLNTVILDSTRSYWVSEFNPVTFCESNRREVKAVINKSPGIPNIADTAHCGPANFALVPQTDSLATQINWYNNQIETSPFLSADTLFTPTLTNTRNYWLSAYNDKTGCESNRTDVRVDVYALPTAINISGPTVVLKGQTGLVFATNGPASSVYNWEVPGGITVDQNMNDFVRLSFPEVGSFNIAVTETTMNGCPGLKITHPIQVIDDSIAVDVGLSDLESCTNAPFLIEPYLFGGTPPFVVEWTGDSAYLNATNTLQTSFYSPGTGVYKLYLKVTDIYLKTAYDTVTITVYNAPSTQITTTDSVVCVGDQLALTTNSTGETPFTHRWFGPVSNLDKYNVANPVFTPIDAGTSTFFYQLTDAHGCSSNDSITILSDIPVANFEIETDPGCSPLTVKFNNLSQQAISYEWDFKDGGTSEEMHPEHNFVNSSSEVKYFNVTLTAYSELGCSDHRSSYVSVWPNPVADITAVPSEACSPANVIIYSTPGNTNYQFDFGNGQTYEGTQLTQQQTYQNTGFTDKTYIANVITETAFGCKDSAQTTITVYATPEANFTIDPRYDTVPNNTFQLFNNTQGNYSFQWDFGNGTTSKEINPGSITYQSAGNYNIQLKSFAEHCTDSITKTAYLYPAKPIAGFKSTGPGCMPHTVTFLNSSEYADNYYWDFGNGSISTAQSPSYTYYQPGKYRISLTVKGDGGESYYSDTLSVFQLPNSYFDLAPRYVYVNDEAVYYFNLSDHADIFEWDFGDGTVSTERNPSHVYKEEGTYDVTLKVWTDNDCFDLFIMENAVLVEPSGSVRYPNVFRPQSPIAENRVFLPGVIDNVDKYHLMIFNRWGGLIFESRNVNEGWDGYYKGKIAKQDVYIYKVTGTYTDGKAFKKTGDVTLMY